MNTAGQITKQIQTLLGVEPDGLFQIGSLAALHNLINTDPAAPWPAALQESDGEHAVIATSFADPRDVAKYREAKAAGHSENYALSVGDNGIGFWEDDVTGPTPACALPPEILEAKWGPDERAPHNKPVVVTAANGKEITCLVQDHMPHERNIKNGAGIDLNPAAVAALGLEVPLRAPVKYRWA